MNFERLRVSVDYWNEVAPEGATCLIDKGFFVKWEDGEEYNNYLSEGDLLKGWVLEDSFRSLTDYRDEGVWHIIKKPAPVGSEEGHPPVREECEYRKVGNRWRGELCTPIHFAEDLDRAWLKFEDHSSGIYVLSAYEFRPAGTYQFEVERLEVVNLAFRSLSQTGKIVQALGELYDKGMLKKAES